MTDIFNIDDLEGAEFGGAPVARGPVTYTELGGHYEACPKCRGTGQTRWGVCFKCQGKKGKTFVQPAGVRAANREKAADRRDLARGERVVAFKDAHPAEWAWLESRVAWEVKEPGRGVFGQSLVQGIMRYGDLTERQLAAVRTNLAKRAAALEAAGQRVATAPKIEVARIEQAFATAAANGLKRLTLRLATTTVVDGKETLKRAFTFTPAPATGKNPGAIYVKQGDEYLGKVVAGAFKCVATCGDERRDEIVAVAGDPAKAAVAYGKVVGACAICARELTDPESIARGIGPICAERYAF